MKTNGVGDVEWNRDVLEEIQSSIADEKAELKIAKSANERLGELLVGIRQGSNGLFNRLMPFHSTLFLAEEAPKLGDIDLTNSIQVASEVLEVIQFTEKTLGRILSEIGGIRLVPKLDDAGNQSRPQTPGDLMNVRISPKAVSHEDALINITARDKGMLSVEDTPTRSELKFVSENLRDQSKSHYKEEKHTLFSSPKTTDIAERVNEVLEKTPCLD